MITREWEWKETSMLYGPMKHIKLSIMTTQIFATEFTGNEVTERIINDPTTQLSGLSNWLNISAKFRDGKVKGKKQGRERLEKRP